MALGDGVDKIISEQFHGSCSFLSCVMSLSLHHGSGPRSCHMEGITKELHPSYLFSHEIRGKRMRRRESLVRLFCLFLFSLLTLVVILILEFDRGIKNLCVFQNSRSTLSDLQYNICRTQNSHTSSWMDIRS